MIGAVIRFSVTDWSFSASVPSAVPRVSAWTAAGRPWRRLHSRQPFPLKRLGLLAPPAGITHSFLTNLDRSKNHVEC